MEVRKPSKIYFDTADQKLEFERAQEERARNSFNSKLDEYTNAQADAFDKLASEQAKAIDSLNIADAKPKELDPVTALLNPSPPESEVMARKYAYDAAHKKFRHKMTLDDNFNEVWQEPDTYKDYLAGKGISPSGPPKRAYEATLDFAKDSLDYISLAYPKASDKARKDYKEQLLDFVDGKLKRLEFENSLQNSRGVIGPDGKPLAFYSVRVDDNGIVFADITKISYDEDGNPSFDARTPTESFQVPSSAFNVQRGSAMFGPESSWSGGYGNHQATGEKKNPAIAVDQAVLSYATQKMGLGEMNYTGDLKAATLSGMANLSSGLYRAVDKFTGLGRVTSKLAGYGDDPSGEMVRLADEGSKAVQEQYGSNKLDQSYRERILSGGSRVVGEMIPLIVEMFATRGMDVESLPARFAQMSPIGLQTYGAEVGSRLNESDSYATLADSLRNQGKIKEADEAQAESDRLKRTADTAGFLSAMREMVTEVITKNEQLLTGGVKATLSNFALSIPKNVIEDVSSSLLEIPQRKLMGDRPSNESLLDVAGTSAVAAIGLGGIPTALNVGKQAYGNLNPSLDFGASKLELDLIGTIEQMSKNGTVATPATADAFVAEQRDHTYETPVAEGKTVTDDSGTVFVKTPEGFQSPSGNVIPVYQEGKGAVLQGKYEAQYGKEESSDSLDDQAAQEQAPTPLERQSSQEQPTDPIQQTAATQERQAPNQDATFEDEVYGAIREEFPLYQGDNKAGEKKIAKTLSPLSYVWNGLKGLGYSIGIEKNTGERQSGGIYVDHDAKKIIFNIADFNASNGSRTKGWTPAAIQEEVDHVIISSAGIDTKSLAAQAPQEITDAVREIYSNKDLSGASLGDEMLRMFIQGKITKDESGKWKVGGKSVTETHYSGFEGAAREAISKLFSAFEGHEAGVNSEGASDFSKALLGSFDKVAHMYEKTFGESIYSDRIRKELTSGDFSYNAKQFLYKLAGKSSDFVDFATNVISKLFTGKQQDTAEVDGPTLDAITRTYDAHQSDKESILAGITGTIKEKASALTEALKSGTTLAAREIAIKMGAFFGDIAKLTKWATGILGRALKATEVFGLNVAHQISTFVKQLKAKDVDSNNPNAIWEHIKNNRAIYAAVLSSVQGFTSFNAEAFNDLYKDLRVGSFEQFNKVVAFKNGAYKSSKKSFFQDRTNLNTVIRKAGANIELADESLDLNSLSEGDILFAASKVSGADLASLRERGVSVISPDLSPIKTGDLSRKEWEQSVLGENKIQTLSVIKVIGDLFERAGNKEGSALFVRASKLAAALAVAEREGRDTSGLVKERKAILAKIDKLASDEAFQKELAGELADQLGVQPHQVFLKPANGANSEGIRHLNRDGAPVQFQYNDKEVIAQRELDLDPKKSFRIHVVNDNGKWYVIPVSTFSRDIEFDEDGQGKNYNYLPVIAGEYLNDAMDAESSALDMLNQIQDDSLNDRLLSLDLEYDKVTGRYYILEFNPSGEKGGGGYIANFFVMDGLVSMFTGKVPEFVKLAELASKEAHTYDSSRSYSSPGSKLPRKKAVIFNANRSKAQRAAIASHTYEKHPAIRAFIGKINYKFLSPSDKIALDNLLASNPPQSKMDAVRDQLKGIKARSDVNWFKEIKTRFPEILAGKDFSTIFDNNIEAVRAEVRHTFTYEAPENEKTDADKNIESASEKRRKELIAKVDEARNSVWEYIIPSDGDQMESWTELDARHKAQIANNLKLLEGIDLESLPTKKIARMHAILQAIITDGDFFGFHDLMSVFRAQGVYSFVAEAVKKGDIFNDPSLAIDQPISKQQARVDSVFRYAEAQKIWDIIYGSGTPEVPSYMANVESYHARLARANARVSEFFHSNKMGIDARLAAGIASILTQYNPMADETAEFNTRLEEIRSSINAMREFGSDSLVVNSQIVSDIFDIITNGLPSVVIDGPAARAHVESVLASNPGGRFNHAYKALDFARNEFNNSRSEARYIKTVVFGEQFQDIENYVHLLARNAQRKRGYKGNEEKSLGTQENALKDRRGLPLGSSYYYDLDIGTMLFDGLSDHMYEYETAYNRLMLSHLHNKSSNDSLVRSYRRLFSTDENKANKRWEETTSVLQSIHHGITSAAFSFEGVAGDLINGFKFATTIANGFRLINIANAPAQIAAAVVGLAAHIGTGRISFRGLGKALALMALPNMGREGFLELIQGMSPNLNMRAQNVDAQFDYQKHGSQANLSKYSRMHRRVVDRTIASIKAALSGGAELITDSVSFLVRLTNGHPDRAIAAFSFLASYFDSYEKRNNTKISTLDEFRDSLSNIDFGAVHEANRITDKIMGNPSNPESRASLFQAKTPVSDIVKSALFMFAQTSTGLASTGANGLKSAFLPGGRLTKNDIAVRFAGLSDALSSMLQAVVFPMVKYAIGPYLISQALYSILKRDDKDLKEEEKEAKKELESLYLLTEKTKMNIKGRQLLKALGFQANMNYKDTRLKSVSVIQSIVPILSGELGDIAVKMAMDKVSAEKIDKYWQMENFRWVARQANITAEMRRNKDAKKPNPPDLERELLASKVMIEITKGEMKSDSKLHIPRSDYGGTFSTFTGILDGIAEFKNDEPALRQIRLLFENNIPGLSPYARVEKAANAKSDAREKRMRRANEKGTLEREALDKK